MELKERLDQIESEASALGIQTELADEIAALKKDLEQKVSEDLDARAEELLKQIKFSDGEDQDEKEDPEDELLNCITAK